MMHPTVLKFEGVPEGGAEEEVGHRVPPKASLSVGLASLSSPPSNTVLYPASALKMQLFSLISLT